MANKPPKFEWPAEDVAEAFSLYQQKVELHFKVYNTKDEDQVPLILLGTGDEGLRRYNSWPLPEADKQKADVVFKTFLEGLEPAENFRVCRMKLMKFTQKAEESIDDFVTRCRLLARKCKFTDDELNERLLE